MEENTERVEAKMDENFSRIEEMKRNGLTEGQALKVLTDECDALLEDRYLFERSLNFDVPQFS